MLEVVIESITLSVMKELSREIRSGYPEELLYVDDLALISHFTA